jgi:5'-3' exoribonuclease 1
MNDNGTLNLSRCELFLKELGELELSQFKESLGDVSWLASKRGSDQQVPASPVGKVAFSIYLLTLAISISQKELYLKVKSFIHQSREEQLVFEWGRMPAKDRKFLTTLLDTLGLVYEITSPSSSKSSAIITITFGKDDDSSDEESEQARSRVMKKYDNAQVLDDAAILEEKKIMQQKAIELEFVDFKKNYYKEKMEIDYNDNVAMSKIVYSYIEGVSWVLRYYYHGCASWSWFYPYHCIRRLIQTHRDCLILPNWLK